MPCYYPQALLALCNAYDMDENNSQSYREFIEIVYFWMHEMYGNCDSVYDERDRFNVSVPSSSHQKKIYDWFVAIKDIFDFSNMNGVVDWFYDVLDENQIDLGFNMLEVEDQKKFIQHYKQLLEGEMQIGAQEIQDENEVNLLDITNDSVISYISQDEDVGPSDTSNVTVRGVRRVIDFDDFVNELAEEAATERENAQDTNYDSDTSMPPLLSAYDSEEESDSDIGSMPELEGLSDDDSSDDDSSDDEMDENDLCHHQSNGERTFSGRSIRV